MGPSREKHIVSFFFPFLPLTFSMKPIEMHTLLKRSMMAGSSQASQHWRCRVAGNGRLLKPGRWA